MDKLYINTHETCSPEITHNSNMSKIQYFQNFEYEIKINIFKYVNSPLNLALTCRNWSVFAKDPYAKTQWLIIRYGKAHALFQAVRLGPTFIDIPVCQTLIARKVIISRYFVQRLLMHFGKYDQTLIELKIEHNVGQLDADRIRAKKIKSPWARSEEHTSELQSQSNLVCRLLLEKK